MSDLLVRKVIEYVKRQTEAFTIADMQRELGVEFDEARNIVDALAYVMIAKIDERDGRIVTTHKSDFITRGGALLKYIGKDERVIIPDGVVFIGPQKFLSEDIKNGLVGIWSWAKTAPKEIIIPGTVKQIAPCAFSAQAIKEIIIPPSVQVVGHGAFEMCAELERAVLSESMTEIDFNTFLGCENLREVIIPNGVERIKAFAFANCKSLKKVLLPKSIKHVDDNAFFGCDSLCKLV